MVRLEEQIAARELSVAYEYRVTLSPRVPRRNRQIVVCGCGKHGANHKLAARLRIEYLSGGSLSATEADEYSEFLEVSNSCSC
jgi:hypothetical protein